MLPWRDSTRVSQTFQLGDLGTCHKREYQAKFMPEKELPTGKEKQRRQSGRSFMEKESMEYRRGELCKYCGVFTRRYVLRPLDTERWKSIKRDKQIKEMPFGARS